MPKERKKENNTFVHCTKDTHIGTKEIYSNIRCQNMYAFTVYMLYGSKMGTISALSRGIRYPDSPSFQTAL